MTAINPAKLKIQAAQLGELVLEPSRLIPRLHDMLAFYGARIRQTSLKKTPLTLQSYQVPTPVLTGLENEFKERLQETPAAGLPLADALWLERWVEYRQLAIFILGNIPLARPAEILTRIREWLGQCTADDIRLQIMTTGLGSISVSHPDLCLDFIQELAGSASTANHQAALFGLDFFASNPDYKNLPILYKTLVQILESSPSGLSKEISSLLQKLIERSEGETAYFLAQQLGGAANARMKRIARQVLPSFSPENQLILRKKLEK